MSSLHQYEGPVNIGFQDNKPARILEDIISKWKWKKKMFLSISLGCFCLLLSVLLIFLCLFIFFWGGVKWYTFLKTKAKFFPHINPKKHLHVFPMSRKFWKLGQMNMKIYGKSKFEDVKYMAPPLAYSIYQLWWQALIGWNDRRMKQLCHSTATANNMRLWNMYVLGSNKSM